MGASRPRGASLVQAMRKTIQRSRFCPAAGVRSPILIIKLIALRTVTLAKPSLQLQRAQLPGVFFHSLASCLLGVWVGFLRGRVVCGLLRLAMVRSKRFHGLVLVWGILVPCFILAPESPRFSRITITSLAMGFQSFSSCYRSWAILRTEQGSVFSIRYKILGLPIDRYSPIPLRKIMFLQISPG